MIKINQSLIKLLTLSVIFCAFLMGCTATTTSLWKKPSYIENINQFLATENGESIVFIGEKHHYIFKSAKSLKNILTYKHRSLFEAHLKDSFIVDEKSKITGDIKIICKCYNTTNKQITELIGMGFMKDNNKEHANQHSLKLELNGIRYLNKHMDFSKYSQLNNAYKVTIQEPHTGADIVVNSLLTPIAVAQDGIATLIAIPLAAIALPFHLVDKMKDE